MGHMALFEHKMAVHLLLRSQLLKSNQICYEFTVIIILIKYNDYQAKFENHCYTSYLGNFLGPAYRSICYAQRLISKYLPEGFTFTLIFVCGVKTP